MTLVSASFQLREQKNRIEWYQKENERLDSRTRTLEENVDSLETFARENFHFAAEGEDIYLIDE